MVTIRPTMNLMALLKAWAIIEVNEVRVYRDAGHILVERFIDGEWCDVGKYDLSKSGLEKCLEYVNLPF